MYRLLRIFTEGKFAKICLLVFLAWLPFGVYSQQEPQFTQFMFNRLSYNPGYAGSNGALCFTGIYRSQWMGANLSDISGNPSTPQNFVFSFDMPVNILHGGIGATVITDKIGYWNNTFVKLDYAYRVELPTGNLAFGLEGQLFNASLDFGSLVGGGQIDEDDNIGSSNDPVLSGDKFNDFLFDLGLGIYYQIPGKFYAGVSSSKLLQTRSDKLKWDDRRSYYIVAGYDWTIPSNPSLRLLPNILIKTEFSSFQLDASAILEYDHKFWGGLNYRVQDAISLLGGFSLGGFKVGVSYDIPTSNFSTRTSGTLELFVRYCFKVDNPPKPATIYNNTRRM